MNAVNLLPSSYRPRRQGESQGSASILLGALGLLLIAVLGYALISSKASDRQSKAVALNQEAQVAEARIAALKPYEQFAELKRTREDSVTQLAQSRIDWERTMRELSRLLPAHVWLSSLDASATPQDDTSAGSSSSSSASSASSSSSNSSASGGPSMKLTGCAPTQPAVAATLVRLRALYGADDVTLSDSTKADENGSSGEAPAPAGASGGAGNCPDYEFNISVDFGPGVQMSGGKVPTSLGGGK